MSSSKDYVPHSKSVTYPTSTSDSVPPASFIQIQNELTPARSPGSFKVRFSEKTGKCDSTAEFGDPNRSVPLDPNSLSKSETACSSKPSPTSHHIAKNSLSHNPLSLNGIIAGNSFFS